MTIQDLGSIGELIAAIATVATLAYLAVQLRQNTRTVRAGTRANQTQSIHTLNALLVQEQENELFWNGLSGELEEKKTRRFDALLSMMVQNLEQSWQFFEDDVIDEATWAGQMATIEFYASQPGFRRWWSDWGDQMNPNFAKMINGNVSKATKGRNPIEDAVQQNAAADEV